MLDPWLAVFLTSVVPGAGHWYIGHKLRGIVFLILVYSIIGFLLNASLFLLSSFSSQEIFQTISIGLLFAIIALYIWFLIMRDAYQKTHHSNLKKGIISKNSKFNKSAWFYVFISRIFPGLGQIFLGRIIRGLMFIISYFLVARFSIVVFSSIARVVILIIAIIDTFNCAQSVTSSAYNLNWKISVFIISGIIWTNLLFPLSIFKLTKLMGG
jgi:signal peptidase I